MSKPGCVLFLLTIGLLWNTACTRRIPAPRFAGPYKLIIRSVGNKTDEYRPTGKIWSQLTFSRPKARQLQHTWGYFYGGIPIGDNLRVEVRLSQWSNHEWKRNAFVLKFEKACSAMQFHAKCIVDLLYEPHEKRCPLPKVGLREIKNQTFDAVFPQFPILPYNRYLFTVAAIDKDETVGIAVADGVTVPKS